MNTIKAHVIVTEGKKTITAGLCPISSIQSLMLEAMPADKVMAECGMVEHGYSITFKHKGMDVTVSPLADYNFDHY